MRIFTRSVWGLGLLAAAWLAAVGGTAVAGGALALPEDLLDRAAALSTPADTNRYPDADTVLLAGLHRVRYAPDGTYEQWHEEYVKILTEKGRRDHLTLSSYFVIPYQRGPEDCVIAALNIVKPDGRVVAIDVAGQSRVMVNPSSMAANIYNPNEKLVVVNVAGLEIGDVLHFVLFDRIVQPRMADSWSDWYMLESTRPIALQVIEVDAPEARPLASMALKDPVGETVHYVREARDAHVRHRWEARDVPQAFPEPQMPPLRTVVQRLLVSTNPDWESVSRWYWNLSLPRYTMTPDIAAKVTELSGGRDDPEDRLRALFAFVAQEIRYMGIIAESEAPGYEPHDIGDTFAARHGVCRDKAALLVCMLREAGLEAYPVLIHNGPRKDPEVPQPYFNHAIVGVRAPDGGFRLMDPTDETTRDLMPSYLDDRSYLVATPAGEALRTSPIAPATDHLMDIETVGTVDAAGRLRGETQLRFHGINDNAYRAHFAQMQPGERRRFLEGALRSALPGARMETVEWEPSDLLDMRTGLTARLVFTAEDVLLQGEDLALLPLPLLGTRVGVVNFILGQTGLTQRRFPLKTTSACGIRERLVLELDPVFDTPVALPTPAPFADGGAHWSMRLVQSGRFIDVDVDSRLESVEFSPDDYLALKAMRVAAERGLRQMPVYQVPGGFGPTADTDAVIEEERVRYDALDDGRVRETRAVRKRILTYAGKKQHSELTVRFNPAWDEVELVRAVVTTAEGREVEIGPLEQNEMDADWVGSAPRYPPGRLLVASFPAVDIGATIDYVLTVTRRDRPFFACREVFGGPDAIRHKSLELRLPAGRPPQLHRHGAPAWPLDEAIFSGGVGADSYAWSAQALPATRREEQMPPDWWVHPTISISLGSWEDFAKTLSQTLERAAARQPLCIAEGRRLAKAHADPWRRLEAIRDRVMLNVRPAGPSLPELPLTAISPADRTWQDGYGHLTDRAVVLAAMLRAAGFRAAFVAVSRRPAIAAFRPSMDAVANPEIFTDVLVQVSGGGLDTPAGRGLYLGDGDQYGAIGATAFEGMWALTLPRGERVPLRPAREDRVWTEHRMDLDAMGDARLTQRTLYFGTAYGSEHRRHREMTPEDARRHHAETIARFSQAATPVGEPVVDFSGYPGRVEFTVDLPAFAVRDGALLYVRLPDAMEAPFSLRSDRRDQPLFLDGRGVWKSQSHITAPAGFTTVLAPAAQRFRDVGGASLEMDTRTVTDEAGSTDLWLQRELIRRPAIIPPAEYPLLVEWERTLSHPRARTVLLREATTTGASGEGELDRRDAQ